MFRIRRIQDDTLPVRRETRGQVLRRIHQFAPAVLEGGYRTRTLGRNARAFREGLHKGACKP